MHLDIYYARYMIKNYVSRKVRTTYDLNWKQYIIREIKNKNIFRELFKIYLGLSPPHSSAAFLARSYIWAQSPSP